MAVLLSRSVFGVPAGTVTVFPASTEEAIVAQGLGSVSTAAPTAGAQTINATRGRAAIAAGSSSVVITCPYVDPTSTVSARIAQATADTTLTSILRVVPAAGSFTIHGNANATAAVTVSWEVINGVPTPFN